MPSKTSEDTIEKIRKFRSAPNPIPYEQVAALAGVSVSTAHKYGSTMIPTQLSPLALPVRKPVLLGGKQLQAGAVFVGRIAEEDVSIPPLQFDVYDYESFLSLYKKSEAQLYKIYAKEWLSNPFVSLLVEFILNEIFGDGFHFEGEGTEEVEEFFRKDKTRKKLKITTREAVIYGNGFLSLNTNVNNTALLSTLAVPSRSISIFLDADGVRTFAQTKKQKDDSGRLVPKIEDLDGSRLIHLMIKEVPDLAYGVSLLRPNLHFLRSLLDVGGDIPAAIKRAAYSPIVAELDLEGYANDADKEAVVEEYTKKLNAIASATTNYAIDKRHNLRLLNEGAAGAMQLRVTQLIEPILAVVLLNMGMPIGFFLQAASNRAVLREQREGIQRFIAEIKTDIALEIETGLIPRITDAEVKVVWDMPLSDRIRLGRALATYYRLGLISREFFLDAMDIEDDGETFFPVGPGGGGGGDAGVGIPDPSRDDEEEVELSDF